MDANDSPRSPNLLGWATVASAVQLDRQAKLYAAVFSAVGLNIVIDSHSDPSYVHGFVRALGFIILALGVLMYVVFLRAADFILREIADEPKGSRVNRLSATMFLVAVAIASLALVAVVACTGGPLISPFTQYLIGALLLAQLLAPTVQAAWSAFGITAVFFLVAGMPIWFRWISSNHLGWASWHYLWPIVVVAFASTWVNVSDLAADARRRKAESSERARDLGVTPGT
ncbi:MAG TPA: hypothetical protein VMV92_35815 [Streptosporangiaceae bacterium]|nr:hypothetical protein [Streptosporangiaceae bacterium]HVB45669.1 hypothetical protein [Streptosporangiaceae bacterium]